MSKIYDFVQFNGENELLEIRLNTLNDVVDYFVIGSCKYSHSGLYKGLNNIPNDLALKFGKKIIFIEIPYIPHIDPWYNEQNGRHYIFEKIKEQIGPQDQLLICDLDEIPNPEILKRESENLEQYVTFSGDYFLFCLDLWGRKSIDGFLVKKGWVGTTNLNFLRSHRTNFQYKDLFKIIPDSSWHFSSVGSPEWIAKKMSYFGHCNEFNNQARNPNYILELIKNRCGDFSILKPGILQEWDINKLPLYINENQEKFKHLFYKNYK